jgi:transglutaminase-like putative cysteine protease
MSNVTTVFHISVYGLACLTSLMLGWAEGALFPHVFSVPLVMVAFYVTERKQLFRLPTLAANALGILAFLIAGGELFWGDVEARVLSGAHLLVYLSWIVYFQEKNAGQFWWMCVLGVLQVAVGSLLAADEIFGGLLVLYLVCGIWTLSIYSLYQGRQQFLSSQQQEILFNQQGLLGSNLLLAMSESSATIQPEPAQVGGWFRKHESLSASSIRLEPNERWVNLRLLIGTLGMSVLALLIAGGFFLMIPRLWFGPPMEFRDDPTDPIPARSGFAENVALGELGSILESSKRVIQIRIFYNYSGEELDVEQYAQDLGYDEPLFRGSVLSVYLEGRWSVGTLNFGARKLPYTRFEGGVRQDIQLEPMGTNILFAIYPFRKVRPRNLQDHLSLYEMDSVIVRDQKSQKIGRFSYSVLAPNRPKEFSRYSGNWLWPRAIRTLIPPAYTKLPQKDLKRLVQLAREKSGIDAAGPKPSNREMAERLESYLRDSGEFGYSLDNSVQDASIDPVEDFLFNRRAGHCEYFASALALMLRAVGIPSRLISGFKGGVLNSFSGDFEVQERHAHAWVEAAVDGRWIVLDATPAEARSESVEQFGPFMRSWYEMTGLISRVWSDYVINMSISQQESYYNPLAESAKNAWLAARGEKGTVKGAFAAFKEFLSSPERWFSWNGGLITWVLLFLFYGTYWVLRRAIGFLSKLKLRWNKRRDEKNIRIKFYERFRILCESQGLFRETCQTQKEHAGEVFQNLNGTLVDAGLEALPRDLVESFYKVRFGTEELGTEEIDLISRNLSQFERVLQST